MTLTAEDASACLRRLPKKPLRGPVQFRTLGVTVPEWLAQSANQPASRDTFPLASCTQSPFCGEGDSPTLPAWRETEGSRPSSRAGSKVRHESREEHLRRQSRAASKGGAVAALAGRSSTAVASFARLPAASAEAPTSNLRPGSAAGTRRPAAPSAEAEPQSSEMPLLPRPLSGELNRRKQAHSRLQWPKFKPNTIRGEQLEPLLVDPDSPLLSPGLMSAVATSNSSASSPSRSPQRRASRAAGQRRGKTDVTLDRFFVRAAERVDMQDAAEGIAEACVERAAFLAHCRPQKKVLVGSVSTPSLSGDTDLATEAGAEALVQSSPSKPLRKKGRVQSWYTGEQVRQASVSSLLADDAKGKRAPSSGDPAATILTKAIDFESWGVTDDYMRVLSRDFNLADIRHINLSNNRLTHTGIGVLTTYAAALYHLEELHLASNSFGPAGSDSLCHLLEHAGAHLQVLDLGGNDIGDSAGARLAEVFSAHALHLHSLSLARNQLAAQTAKALGQYLSCSLRLESLDVQWNLLERAGGSLLAEGIYNNNCVSNLPLKWLNLAWNRLGNRCKTKPTLCKCSACYDTTRIFKMLASIFLESQTMFHIDLSYNSICAEDCHTLEDGLRENHSLFGIHMVGNAATVDDHGFLVPFSGGLPATVHHRPDVQDHLTDLLRRKKQADKDSEPGPLPAPEDDAHAGSQRIVECCWVCGNWQPWYVSYTPGFSGPELDPSQVERVYAFFSIDGYTRATPLRREERPYQEWRESVKGAAKNSTASILLEAGGDAFAFVQSRGSRQAIQRSVPANAPSRGMATQRRRSVASEKKTTGRRRSAWVSGKGDGPVEGLFGSDRLANFLCNEDGNVVVFVGCRSLPVTRIQQQVVFLVDKCFAISRSMPQQALDKHVHVELDSSTAFSGVAPDPLPVVLQNTNVITTSNRGSQPAEDVHQERSHTPQWMSEYADLSLRGKAHLKPRCLLPPPPPPPTDQWCFEKSNFRGFCRDRLARNNILQCFDHDWRSSKLPLILKGFPLGAGEEVRLALRDVYWQLIAAYMRFCFHNYSDLRNAPGLRMTEHSLLFLDYGGDRFFGESFPVHTCDTVFIGATSGPPQGIAAPKKGMSRPSFLESFVRLAIARYVTRKVVATPVEAVKKMLQETEIGFDFIHLRQDVQDSLFNEECDLIIAEHKELLEKVFKHYKTHWQNNRQGNTKGELSFGGWYTLMQDIGALEFRISKMDFGTAFALGCEVRRDTMTSFRWIELGFSEFLVALGAAVFLSENNRDSEFYPDILQEFLDDFVSRAASKEVVTKVMDLELDPLMSSVLSLARTIFLDADDDRSGLLDMRELKRTLAKPEVAEALDRTLELKVDDFDVLWHYLDEDHSGEVSMDELCQGMVRSAHLLQDKGHLLAYLRKTFRLFDLDGSGTLEEEEVRGMLANASVREKLRAFGVSVADTNQLLEDLALGAHTDRKSLQVTEQKLVLTFLDLRQPRMLGARGLNFLREMFSAADTDKSGELSMVEVKEVFLQDSVSARVRHLGLPVPDWVGLFDALDTDKSGSLSWEEFSDGVSALWEGHLEAQLAEVAKQESSRVQWK